MNAYLYVQTQSVCFLPSMFAHRR